MRRELNQFRPALNWAYRNGWIDKLIKITMPVHDPAPKERFLSREEVRQLNRRRLSGFATRSAIHPACNRVRRAQNRNS